MPAIVEAFSNEEKPCMGQINYFIYPNRLNSLQNFIHLKLQVLYQSASFDIDNLCRNLRKPLTQLSIQRSIWPINKTLVGATTLDHSEPKNNNNKR